MNKFKRGERVVFVKDDDYAGVEMPKGTLATYDDDAPTGGLVRWVRLDTGERVAAYLDAIAPAEGHGTGDGSASDICAEPGCNCDLERRFPAPLDPKAVKPGDTATVTDGKAIITGVVDSVRERAAQLWFRFRFGEQADAYFEVPLSDRFGEAFNLTAHTPAPEPEPEPAPEWRPGQFVSGVVEGTRHQGMVDDLGNFLFWNHESEGAQEEPIAPGVVTDVRRLVVLDPADVGRLWAIIREVDGSHDLGPGALAEAILERLAR